MGKTSDTLPKLFKNILDKYQLHTLYYAKGPGSFMAIKVSYIFLRTLSITYNIPLYATEGFTFNANHPIKATGALYFMKKDGKISTKKIKAPVEPKDFILPQRLEPALFTEDIEPLYVLPAV
jgi:tRNA A37 threonylcarbamoyladenosine modification protein TsaB